MLKIDEVIVIVSEAKTNYERKVIYGLVFCIASCMLTACKEVGAPPLIASSSEQAKTTDSTKDIIPCLEGIEQWYLGNDGCYAKFVSEYSWESDVRRTVRDIDINYFEGMEVYSENRATIVAVIDTDIDTDMFSDKGNLWTNQTEIPDDGLDNDENGYVDDFYGWDFCTNGKYTYAMDSTTTHGNNIVGILIGSVYHPEYVGILDSTKNQVMALKAVSENEIENIKPLIEAIRYAENNGADICCLALSTYADNSILYETIEKSSMLFIVAAGNDGVELGADVSVFPAMYDLANVITVADVRCDGQMSRMSNYSEQHVDVFAPGTDIICVSDLNGYEFVSGTSVSTSIVAGICVLVRSGWDTELSPGEIKQLLIESSRKDTRDELLSGKGGVVSLYHILTSMT